MLAQTHDKLSEKAIRMSQKFVAAVLKRRQSVPKNQMSVKYIAFSSFCEIFSQTHRIGNNGNIGRGRVLPWNLLRDNKNPAMKCYPGEY